MYSPFDTGSKKGNVEAATAKKKDAMLPDTIEEYRATMGEPDFSTQVHYFNKGKEAKRQALNQQLLNIQASDKKYINPETGLDTRNVDEAAANMALTGVGGVIGVAGNVLNTLPRAVADSLTSSVTGKQRDLYKITQEKLANLARIDKANADYDIRTEEGLAGAEALQKLRKQYELTPEEQALFDQREVPETEVGHGTGYAKYGVPGKEVSKPYNQQPLDNSISSVLDAEQMVEDYFINPVDTGSKEFSKRFTNAGATEDVTEELAQAVDNNIGDIQGGWESLKEGDVKSSTKLIKGLGNLILDGGEALINNPQGVGQVIAGSGAQMALAVAAPITGVVSMASESNAQSTKEFVNKHGRSPELEERQIIAATAIAGALAEKVGAAASFGKSDVLKVLKTATTKGKIKDAGTTVAAGILEEGATESAQSLLEQYAVKQDASELSYKEAYINGMLGAGAGGAMASIPAVVKAATSGITKTVDTVSNKSVRESAAITLANSSQEAPAIEVESLEAAEIQDIDINSPTGLNTALRNAERIQADKEATPLAKKEAAMVARAMVKQAESKLEGYAEAKAEAEKSLEGMTDKAEIAETKDFIKGLVIISDRYQKTMDKRGAAASIAFSELALPADEINEIASRLNITESMETLTKSPEQFGSEYAGYSSEAEVDAAVKTVMQQMAINPDAVSIESTRKILDNASIKLNEEQVLFLNTHLATSELTEKNTVGVRDNIINGGEGFKGFLEYRNDVYEAIQNNDKQTALRVLGSLTKFTKGMSDKAAAFSKAFDNLNGFAKADVPGYFQADGVTPAFVHERQPELVSRIISEANYLKEGVAILESLVIPTKGEETSVTTEEQVNTPKEEKVTVPKSTVVKEAQADLEALNKSTQTVEEEAGTKEVETEASNEPVATPEQEVEQTPDEEVDVAAEAVTEVNEAQRTVDTAIQPNLEAEEAYYQTEVAKNKAPSESDRAFRRTNQFVKFFTPKKVQNALSGVQNLMDTLLNGTPNDLASLAKEYTESGEFSEQEVAQLRNLGNFHKTIGEVFRKSVKKMKGNDALFLNQTPIRYLADANGEFNEFVVGAMTASAYDWIGTRGTGTRFNDASAINNLLKLDSKNKPDGAQWERLSAFGVSRDTVILELGRNALRYMNMNQSKDIPLNIKSQLEMSIGLEIYNALVKDNYLTPTSINVSELIELGGDYVPSLNSEGEVIDKAVLGVQLNDTYEADTIIELTGKSNGIINELMGAPRSEFLASIGKPFTETNKVMKNSAGQTVPAEVDAANKEYGKNAFYFNPNMHKAITSLGDDILGVILGKETTENRYVGLLPSIVGKNRTVDRDITNYRKGIDKVTAYVSKFGGGLTTTPIYFNSRYGKQMRNTMQGSDLNPQRVKLHRFALTQKRSTIDITKENSVDMAFFRASIAQAFDKSTDKQGLGTTINDYMEITKNPVIVAGVNAMVGILSGHDNTARHDAAILAAVQEGKLASHSLLGLVSLAEYAIAKKANVSTLDTSITYEIDGVTNGPFNATLQLGLTDLNEQELLRLTQGGFFTDGVNTNYSEWAENPTNNDIYKSTTLVAHQELQDMLEAVEANTDMSPASKAHFVAVVEALSNPKIMGDLTITNDDGDITVTSEGRGLLKNPITVTFYGSGAASINKKIADGILENISAQLDDYLNIGTLNQTQWDDYSELMGLINLLAGTNFAMNTPPNDVVFTNRQFENFHSNVARTLGTSINGAINKEFGVQKKNARIVNTAANVIHELFLPKFEAAVESKIAELVEAGTISKYEGLSAAQYAEVKEDLLEAMPIFNTMFNAGTEDKLGEGIFTGKAVNNAPTQSSLVNVRTISNGANTSTSTGGLPSYASPGAGSIAILNIMGGDATTMALLKGMMGSAFLDVYDAGIVGVEGIKELGKNLNIAAYKAVMDYDLLSEVDLTLERALNLSEEYLAGLDYSNAPQGLVDAVSDYALGITEEVGDKLTLPERVAYLKGMLKDSATRNKRAKDNLRKRKITMSQFAGLTDGQIFENGELVETTDSTQEKINEVLDAQNKSVVEAAVEIDESADLDSYFAKKEGVVPEPTAEPVVEDTYPVDDAIVNLFADKGTLTIEEALTGLNAALAASDKPMHKAYKTILKVLIKALPKDLTISVIPKGTVYSYKIGDQELNSSGARGVNAPVGLNGEDSPVIYLSGLGNTYHGMSIETLMHELVHSATSNAMHAYHTGAPQSKTVKAAIKEILELKKSLMDDLDIINGGSEFGYAFDPRDIEGHEFVAWGLTNAKVVDKLNQKQPTKIRKAVNAIVAAVKKILFGEIKSTSLDTAYDQLLTNFVSLAQMGGLKKETLGNSLTLEQRAQESTRNLDAVGIFDSLGKDSEKHSNVLRAQLKDVISQLVHPLVLRVKANSPATTSDEELLLARLDPNQEHNPSSLLALGYKMSAQESYVHQIYAAIIDTALNDFSYSIKEIDRLYALASKQLKAEDFIFDTDVSVTDADYAATLEMAQARRDAIFAPQATDRVTSSSTAYSPMHYEKRKSNYLRNFLVLAQTNEHFRNALRTVDVSVNKVDTGNSIVDMVGNFIAQLFSYLTGFATGTTSNPSAVRRLDKLAANITRINARKKLGIEKAAIKSMSYVSNTMNAGITSAREQVLNILDSQTISNSKVTAVKFTKNVLAMAVSKERADQFANAMEDVQYSVTRGKLGLMGSIYNEMKGTTNDNKAIHKLLPFANKTIDQKRETIKGNVVKLLKQSFKNVLTDAEQKALTKVLLKADLSALLDYGYSYADIFTLVNSPVAANKKIQMLEAELAIASDPADVNFYLRSSRGLGSYMATGDIIERHQLLNVASIAELAATGKNTTTKQVENVKPIVDQLATLHALVKTRKSYRKTLAELMRTEFNRRDEDAGPSNNGITFALEMHRNAKQDALKRTFSGSEHLAIKGYTKEIFNPNKSIVFARKGEKAELESMGYVQGRALNRDKASDPDDTPLYLYVSEEGGSATWLQGIMTTLNKSMKGTNPVSSRAATGSAIPQYSGALDIAHIKGQNAAHIAEMFTSPNPPTKSAGDNFMVPVVNPSGDVVNYRYMMAEQTKDAILEKDNTFTNVLSAMFASTEEKVASTEVNNRLMAALYDTYSQDRAAGRLNGYVEISNKSEDPKIRELYRLMPHEAKETARKLWGKDKLFVRNDLMDVAFGYRKFSLAEAWDKDPQMPKAVQWLIKEVLGTIGESIWGKQFPNKLRKSERILQELVKEVKDIIVIKSVIVLLGNMISNTVQLIAAHRINPITAVRNQHKAFLAAKDYRANAHRLAELNYWLEAGYNKPKHSEYRSEIVILETKQARNPVGDLIEEGLLQSIVEEIDVNADIYSNKHGLVDKINAGLDKLPKPLATGVRVLSMSKDTKAYKLLSEATQLSDFSSRYALYEKLTKRAENPLSKEDAIKEVIDAFINYDLPTHKAIQYGNDMGVFWFFKYFFRVQKVILKAFRDEPARMLMLALGQNWLGVDIADISDSFLLDDSPMHKIGMFDHIIDGIGAHPLLTPF